jgi:hypothetical protein
MASALTYLAESGHERTDESKQTTRTLVRLSQ